MRLTDWVFSTHIGEGLMSYSVYWFKYWSHPETHTQTYPEKIFSQIYGHPMIHPSWHIKLFITLCVTHFVVTTQFLDILLFIFSIFFSLCYFKLILERERKGEREQKNTDFLFHLLCAFIGCFLYVSWPNIEPADLAYQNNTLSNTLSHPARAFCFSFRIFNIFWSSEILNSAICSLLMSSSKTFFISVTVFLYLWYMVSLCLCDFQLFSWGITGWFKCTGAWELPIPQVSGALIKAQ